MTRGVPGGDMAISPEPRLTTYAEAEAWLLSITDYEKLLGRTAVRYDTQTFDLDRFRTQLATLGDPHLRYAVVHVAGTKGKGSTCAMLEAALRACGLKTGLYTSPHLERFTERIRVNGEQISGERFAELVQTMAGHLAPEADPTAGFRTVFEILTAAAFQHFADEAVDVAIIETGLGGRLDSTNVFDRPGPGPLINVITAMGMDHASVLGRTVQEITGEKAGIIRPHSHTVVSMQPDNATEQIVQAVVEKRCADVGAVAPLFVSENLDIAPHDAGYALRRRGDDNGQGGRLSLEAVLAGGVVVKPGLKGLHQAQNAAAVWLALGAMQRAWAPVSPALADRLQPGAVIAGIAGVQWWGRFQQEKFEGVDVVIDGAHCGISARALARACAQEYGDRPAVLVVGFLQDKSGGEILTGLFDALPVARAVAVAPPSARAVSAEPVVDALGEFLPADHISSAADISAGLAAAGEAARELGAYVIVYGSLYLAGAAVALARDNAARLD